MCVLRVCAQDDNEKLEYTGPPARNREKFYVFRGHTKPPKITTRTRKHTKTK